MFRSATLKLTAWYLAILMAISFLFSVAIYQLNYREVNIRLENLQQGLLDLNFLSNIGVMTDQVRMNQSRAASRQMIATLFQVNAIIFVAGGIGSYVLARRTLRPLEKAHDAQSRFTSDASHELRTPLAAMKTELEVNLRDSNLSKKEARELLESNLEDVNRLIALSEMLLKMARLDYDTLDKSTVVLGSALDSVLKQFPHDKDRIKVEGKPNATTFANEAAIEEVMTILIDNALKYSHEKSTITVNIIQKRLTVGFSVSNEGVEIPEEQREKIFERFYRADGSRTHANKHGYGLGLAIAKKIVSIHNGDITLISKDGVTTFTASLPSKRAMSTRGLDG